MAQINPETGLAYQNKSGYQFGTKEWYRNSNLIRKYGISLKEWNELFERQGFMCAVCASKDARGKNWHTDHCHKTGKVRGILCGWCNTAIGKMQDSYEIMASSAVYVLVNGWRDKGGIQDLKKARHPRYTW